MLVGLEGDVALMVNVAVPPSLKAELKVKRHVVAEPATRVQEPVPPLFLMFKTPAPAVVVIEVKPLGSNSLNLT